MVIELTEECKQKQVQDYKSKTNLNIYLFKIQRFSETNLRIN